MRTRCYNPNATSYKNYGAKGVRICKRWDDFRVFIADVGERPQGYQLDRIDTRGDYEPKNVRWASRELQNVNQQPSGKSGIKGVYWISRIRKWAARTCKYHGTKYIGVFDTKEQAASAIMEHGCSYNESSND